MMKKFCLFMLMVVVFVLTGCTTRVVDGQQVAKDEKIVIKFSHVVAENTPKGLAAKRFADLVRERTGGYVEVQVFPNSQLYKDGEELEALKRGDVQMLAPATSKIADMFPQWQALDLPFAFPNLAGVHAFVDGPVGKQLFSQLRNRQLIGLAMWDNGFKQVTSNRWPIILPDDFRGLNFRTMSSATVLQEQFQMLGAKATPMPFNDVYDALASGTVDSQENTISNIYTQQFDQVQKYLTLSNHAFLGYVVIVNSEFWDKLDPGVRKILEDTMAEVTQWERDKAKELNNEQLEEITKKGKLKIYTLDRSQRQVWQKAFEPVYSRLEQEIGPIITSIAKLREQAE